MLERVDQGIESRRIDQALFHQQRFQRLDPQSEIRRRRLVFMIVIVIVIVVLGVGAFVRRHGPRSGQETAPSRHRILLAPVAHQEWVLCMMWNCAARLSILTSWLVR